MGTYDDIAACAAAYAHSRDRLASDADALTDYEAVLRARVALAECLIAAGWTPPADVNDLLMLDRHILDQPNGVIEARSTQA